MDLNERIARLLEPVPVFENECDTGSVGGYWMRTLDRDLNPLTLSPNRRFKESLDDSMRLIERRWPNAEVDLASGRARLTTKPGQRTTRFTHTRSAPQTSEALALALCAALEAETTTKEDV